MDGNSRKHVSREQVLADALRLSTDDRAALMEELDRSLEDHKAEVEAEWVAVALRRLADLEAGRSRAIPGEQAIAELRERLRMSR